MADHVLSPPLTAEQCRDRARLIRYTAAAVKSALLRHDLLFDWSDLLRHDLLLAWLVLQRRLYLSTRRVR